MSMDLTNLINWIPSISTTTLLGGVLYLSRNLIEVRLKNSVKHDYDKKIENLKTILRKNEESFKADLNAKEAKLDALRSGALSGLVNRQATLYERQLAAVEQLWGAVISLRDAKTISARMSKINFEAAAIRCANDTNAREMFKHLASGFKMSSIDTKEASLARPFISPLAWSLFFAYESIIIYGVMQILLLQKGLDEDLIDVKGITEAVKIALPEQKNYIEEHGPGALHYLLDELEDKILGELQQILNADEADNKSVEKAALILSKSEHVHRCSLERLNELENSDEKH